MICRYVHICNSFSIHVLYFDSQRKHMALKLKLLLWTSLEELKSTMG